MKTGKVLKWTGLFIAGVIGLAILAVAVVYAVIGRDLSRTFDLVVADVAVPEDPASISEGQRLATTRGCFAGCHGDTATGAVFFEAPDGTILVAPDIAEMAAIYSTEDLVRVIRHGIRPDGTSVLLPMPSEMFTHLSDEDLGAIIGFLRTVSPGEGGLPESNFGPLGRLMLLFFKQDTGTILAAESIDHQDPHLTTTPENAEQLGRYLAMTSCSECHGLDLAGWPEDEVPPLSIVAAYSLGDFTTLMRTGVPVGGRELDLMALVATGRFAHFTDAEIGALHGFLGTLAGTP